MANKIFIFLVLVVLAFSSCGDDMEAEESDVNKLLIGTWTLSGLAYDGTSTVIGPDGSITETEFRGDAQDLNITLLIEDNPNVYTSAGSFQVAVTSELFGQEVMQDIVFNNFLGDGTWEENDRVLITNDANSGERSETDILEITSNSLILDFSAENAMLVQDMQVNQVISGAAIFRK